MLLIDLFYHCVPVFSSGERAYCPQEMIKTDMNAQQYNQYVRRMSPGSRLGPDLLQAFLVGGAICALGQGLILLWQALGASEADAAAWCSVTLIALSALATGLGWYDDLARFAGAGSLVPITGFSNAVASPALEFKTEGWVTGMAVKIFTIAGPVLVFGTAASVLYGGILCLIR